VTDSTPEAGWIKVPNTFARDKRLSWAARGIGTWLASHSAGFTVSIDRIEAAGPAGRDLVRKAVADLEKYGYLKRSRVRDEKGRLGQTTYRFSFEPESLPSSEPTSDFPTLGKPTQVSPTLAAPTLAAPTLENPTVLRRQESKKTKGLEDQKKEDHSLSSSHPEPAPSRLDQLIDDTNIKPDEREPFSKHIKSKAQNLVAYLKKFGPGDMQGNLDEWRDKHPPSRPRSNPFTGQLDTKPCGHGTPAGQTCQPCLYARVADLYLHHLETGTTPMIPQSWRKIWDQIDKQHHATESENIS
jgi:hypothetical protein